MSQYSHKLQVGNIFPIFSHFDILIIIFEEDLKIMIVLSNLA